MTIPTPPSPAWAGAVSLWLNTLAGAGRPASTLRLRRYQLGRLASGVAPAGPWEVTGDMLAAWMAARTWQANTRRSWRSAIRGFYAWGRGRGLVAVDPSLELLAVRAPDPNPHPTPEDAYRLALARADERVRLMLRLAAELGMRRAEVAACHARWLERDLTGWTLCVVGKGSKVRRLPLSDALAAAIRRRGAGYLFPGNVDGHVSADWAGRLVARALPGAWSMHSLRHRFATAAFSIDHDLLTVQELLGHASPVTTRMYIRLPDERLRLTVAAVGRL